MISVEPQRAHALWLAFALGTLTASTAISPSVPASALPVRSSKNRHRLSATEKQTNTDWHQRICSQRAEITSAAEAQTRRGGETAQAREAESLLTQMAGEEMTNTHD